MYKLHISKTFVVNDSKTCIPKFPYTGNIQIKLILTIYKENSLSNKSKGVPLRKNTDVTPNKFIYNQKLTEYLVTNEPEIFIINV